MTRERWEKVKYDIEGSAGEIITRHCYVILGVMLHRTFLAEIALNWIAEKTKSGNQLLF